MEDPNSDDRLPPGWTVEIRVRKNGKRDKYYFAPSSGLKLKSRVEVFRHLDYAQNKVSIQKISNNVVVKKVIAERLSPGWVKKTRITTKEDTIRSDSVKNTSSLSLEHCIHAFSKRGSKEEYYIDPVSGYAFYSLKDVDRYLETGEIGRNSFKPKDSSDLVSKPDKFSSTGVTSNPASSASIGLSSDLDMIANDQQIPNPACSGEHMPVPVPISEHVSSQRLAATKLTSSVLSQAEGSDQKKGPFVLAESNAFPSCTGDAQERQLLENAQTKHGTEKVQNCQRKRHKKEINLPRRASKRLAGIKVDPVQELQTRSRSRRVTVKQSCEGETITNEDKSPNSLPNGAVKQINTLECGSETCLYDSAANTTKSVSQHFYGKLPTSEKLHEKTEEEHGSNEDKECFPFLPHEKHATMKEHVRILDNGDKVNGKLDYSLDCPLGELLTDPCIAFAIQTLTGVTFETSNGSQISSELKNIEHSETFLAAEGHGTKKIKGSPNMRDNKEECVVFPSLAIPQEHASDPEIDDKAKENNNTGSSSEKTLDILPSWMDPCIEFAIKTLTMPLDSDQNPKNCLQQQQHSDMALSSVNLGKVNQTDYYSSQYFGTQRSMFKQKSFDDPTRQHTRNVGIGNSAGARLPHWGEDRSNIWQR